METNVTNHVCGCSKIGNNFFLSSYNWPTFQLLWIAFPNARFTIKSSGVLIICYLVSQGCLRGWMRGYVKYLNHSHTTEFIDICMRTCWWVDVRFRATLSVGGELGKIGSLSSLSVSTGVSSCQGNFFTSDDSPVQILEISTRSFLLMHVG